MRLTAYDIETSSLPRDHLLRIMPEFKAAGNLKDPAKIAADIEDKKQSWLERAALDATTGKVLAIGIKSDHHQIMFHGHDEAVVLKGFWDYVREVESSSNGGCEWVGFNSSQFDLPFLFQRSFINRIARPVGIREGRYWSRKWIDLREVWNCGRKDQSGSLDAVAKALGVGEKAGSGADFAKLYDTDQPKALAYLAHDLDLTLKVAEVLL